MHIFKSIYFFFVDTIQTLLLAASVFLVIYVFLFRPFQVNGESMFPNFEDREYVLTNLITLRFEELKRGDVIVFKAPTDPDKDFIKRVIGVPGDTVSLKNGDVYVNREKINQSVYIDDGIKTYGGAFLQEGETKTVPYGEYFVMGDNRPRSSDSREWGFLKKENIIGKSFFIYWPLDRAKFVKNPYESQ